MDEYFKIIFSELLERKKLLEKKLFKNVLVQIIAIVVGLSYILNYDIHSPTGSTIKEFTIDGQIVKIEHLIIDMEIIIIGVPLVLLYFFIEFGYSIGLFFYLNRSYKIEFKKLLNSYYGSRDSLEKDYMRTSFDTVSIFEQLPRGKSKSGYVPSWFAGVVITIIIFANHFISYKTLELLSNNWLTVLISKLILTGILFFFYREYNSARRKNDSPIFLTNTVTVIAAIIAIYFIADEIFPNLKL